MTHDLDKLAAGLTEPQRDFLIRVHDGLKLGPATDAADKVRQSVRRAGLVRVVMNPRRWVTTELGTALRHHLLAKDSA